jgi:hypothetical protein
VIYDGQIRKQVCYPKTFSILSFEEKDGGSPSDSSRLRTSIRLNSLNGCLTNLTTVIDNQETVLPMKYKRNTTERDVIFAWILKVDSESRQVRDCDTHQKHQESFAAYRLRRSLEAG